MAKRLTPKKGKIFVDKFTEGIIKLGAVKTKPYIDSFVSFELKTTVGKLEINLPVEQSVCYTVFSRFENVDKAKVKFDCNPYSGKYNSHLSPDSLDVEQAVEISLRHFEYTLE